MRPGTESPAEYDVCPSGRGTGGDLRLTRRIQVEESWSFVYAKQKNFPYPSKKAPPAAGEAWTSMALDADNKLMVSWLVGPPDSSSAYELMMDLSECVKNRIQLTTDGLAAYLPVVEDVFGADVDFAQLQPAHVPRRQGQPDH